MKTTITQYDFRAAFLNYGRGDQFSYNGLTALFEWLEMLEDDMAEEIELDVIALCCEFTEDTIDYFLEQYDLKSIDELEERTTVIRIPGTDDIIIQDY